MAVPLHLPDPIDERLEHSPLRLVVCQVRHSKTVGVSDPGLLIKVQEQLGDTYPNAQPFEQQEVVFAAGPAGATASTKQSQQGWQLKSDDGSWTLTLQTDYFSIETSAYTNWRDFRQRFGDLLTTVNNTYGPKLEQRVGLRYVDEIERADLDSPYAWRERIEDTVLGPVADKDLGPSVRVAQQILELEGPDNTRVLLRHGCESVHGGKAGSIYRLDHDCFRQRSRPFEVESILHTIDELHRMALQLFQKAITESMYEELKGEGVTE